MKTWTLFTCDVITKTCCGFESQSISSDLEEITHLHVFCDSVYFSFSYHGEEEENLTSVVLGALPYA